MKTEVIVLTENASKLGQKQKEALCNIQGAFYDGYKVGYEDGKHEGAYDAEVLGTINGWQLALRIFAHSIDEWREIFAGAEHFDTILRSFSPQEAKLRLDDYEERQRLEKENKANE